MSESILDTRRAGFGGIVVFRTREGLRVKLAGAAETLTNAEIESRCRQLGVCLALSDTRVHVEGATLMNAQEVSSCP